MPLFFPSLRLIEELYPRHHAEGVLGDLSWQAIHGVPPGSCLDAGSHDPNAYDRLDQMAPWIALADFYDPENMTHATQFDSFDHLRDLLANCDPAAISQSMKEASGERRARVYAAWLRILERVTGRPSASKSETPVSPAIHTEPTQSWNRDTPDDPGFQARQLGLGPEQGQLLPKEREALFHAVLARRPTIVLEVGTWRGGGSTHVIATALNELGQGVLHTCEPDKECHDAACALFAGSDLEPFVHLHQLTSAALIKRLLDESIVLDFIFFDGPDDPEVALNDLITLTPHLRPGCVFAMHDWADPDGKCRLIRPYLENAHEWSLKNIIEPPGSVGLCVFEKLS